MRPSELDAVVVYVVGTSGSAQRGPAHGHQTPVGQDRRQVPEQARADDRHADEADVAQKHADEQRVGGKPERTRKAGWGRPWEELGGKGEELKSDRRKGEPLPSNRDVAEGAESSAQQPADDERYETDIDEDHAGSRSIACVSSAGCW